jgi:hypothetical protein
MSCGPSRHLTSSRRVDRPQTLGTWLKGATTTAAPWCVVNQFMLGSLKPWLAYVRRDRIDLRTEYPVLRTKPAPEKQSPHRWAGTELDDLEGPEVKELLGFSLSRHQREDSHIEAFVSSIGGPSPTRLVNPLWLAAELAELGRGDLGWILDSREISLLDFDTLISLSHGDLHLDNVLCASTTVGDPRPVLIDFESAHPGHICKDFARLEASVICHLSAPTRSAEHVQWFWDHLTRLDRRQSGERRGTESSLPEQDPARAVALRLQEICFECGQGHWPIKVDEYLVALYSALLPMVRYTTLEDHPRKLALVLATLTATALMERWERLA